MHDQKITIGQAQFQTITIENNRISHIKNTLHLSAKNHCNIKVNFKSDCKNTTNSIKFPLSFLSHSMDFIT